MNKLILGIFCLFLVSCSTPYQSFQNSMFGSYGGYDDYAISEHRFSVSFAGNPSSSKVEVEQKGRLRCAQVTLERGFAYFKIVLKRDMGEEVQTMISAGNGIYIPTTNYYPGVTYHIECAHEQLAQDFINAQDYLSGNSDYLQGVK